jgi:hypothetical protein
MRFLYLTVIILMSFLNSCYNDSEETLFPQAILNGQQCDTSIYTYSGAIKPIIDGSCISCHATQAPKLDNYADVTTYADRILGAIKHKSGYIAMPLSPAPQLEDCKIFQFEKWVAAGKKNN